MINPNWLSNKKVIYGIISVSIVVLILLNFWGWFFVSNLESRMLTRLQTQGQKNAALYARLISEKVNEAVLESTDFTASDVFTLNEIQILPVIDLMIQFSDAAALNALSIVSLDQTEALYPVSASRSVNMPINEPLFQESSLRGETASERRLIDGQYYIIAYAPLLDLEDIPQAVLYVEIPAEIFREIDFFRQTLLYMGITGLLLIILFSFLIWTAIRRLFAMEAQLQQQNRLAHLGQMAAMVAHEIRNPLSIIKGSADVLRKKYADANDELFEFIPEEINRLNRLVNDFLQFARKRELDLTPLAADKIIERLTTQMNDGRIHLALKGGETDVPLEEDAFKQVILNIVDNALKAIEDNGKVEVRTSWSRQRGYLIEVEDNGPGMSAETVSKIFDPFFSTRATGSGLGMAITLQLVEQMRGEIKIDSKETVGTTVSVVFKA